MSKKLAREQLYVIIGVIVLVLILVAAVSTVLWLKQDKDSTDTPGNTTLTKEEAEQERLSRQVDDARAKELQGLIASEADKQTKAQQLNELMLIYLNRGEYEQALSFAKEADKVFPTALSAGGLGDVYFAMKDFKQAAMQYGVAMDRSEKTATTQRSPYTEYAILKKKAEDAQ